MGNSIFDDLEKQLQNPYLTREDKVKLIEDAGNRYRASVDEDLNKYIRQQQLGTAIEIASAIPIGGYGVAKVGAAKATPILARKVFGNKIAQDMTKSAIGSAIDGAIFGAGRSLVEDKNPLETMSQDAIFGFGAGAAIGGAVGNLATKARAAETNGINKMRKHWGIPWRKASGTPEQAIDILMENQRGFVPNVFDKPGIGKFDMPWGTSKYGLAHALERRAKQKNLDLKIFTDNIPKTIREGIVKAGSELHPNTYNILSPNQKLSINTNFNHGETNRNWITTAIPQGKKARKHLGRVTPSLDISSETGSFSAPSVSELLAKDSINEYLNKSNPAKWLNPELSTVVKSAENLAKNGGSMTVQPYKLEIGVEENVQIPREKIFTPEEIGNMTPEEFNTNEHAIRNQLQRGLISPTTKDFSGFTNPLTGSNKIYTQEDIGRMSTDEYSAAENEINAQWGSVGIPGANELQGNSGAVYVNGYKRADGTEVRGYYRAR